MKTFLHSLTDGAQNIKLMLVEGKVKLLIRPIVVMLVVCAGLYYYNTLNKEAVQRDLEQIASLKTQKENMSQYIENKQAVVKAEVFFPDIVDKNEWLVTQMIDVFKRADILQKFAGSQTEQSNDIITATVMGADFTADYTSGGRVIAGLENIEQFLTVQELTIVRSSKEGSGVPQNTYVIKVGTVFPKDRAGEQNRQK